MQIFFQIVVNFLINDLYVGTREGFVTVVRFPLLFMTTILDSTGKFYTLIVTQNLLCQRTTISLKTIIIRCKLRHPFTPKDRSIK